MSDSLRPHGLQHDRLLFLHYLLEFAQTHVHWACDVIQPSWGVYGGSDNNEFVCNAGELGLSPGSGRSLEKGMATHSSILAWRTPWIEEPGGLQSMGSQRVGHDWVTNTHTHEQSLPPLCLTHAIPIPPASSYSYWCLVYSSRDF